MRRPRWRFCAKNTWKTAPRDRLFALSIHAEHGAHRAAFRLLSTILESAAEAITYADDSAGVFAGVLREAVRVMKHIAASDIAEDLRAEMVAYVEHTCRSAEFVDTTDVELELWELATAVVRTNQEYQHLRAALQRALPPEHSDRPYVSRYTRERMLVLMAQLMDRFGDQTEVQSLRRENRHLPSLRKELLQQAWDRRDYEETARLAEEGIENDSGLPGLVRSWQNWALSAYQAGGNEAHARHVARDRVVSGQSEHLTTYKQMFSLEEWPSTRRRYRRLAESIRCYAAVAGTEAAVEVREEILREYPRRPAIRDELSRL